jgi:hypothetical protein
MSARSLAREASPRMGYLPGVGSKNARHSTWALAIGSTVPAGPQWMEPMKEPKHNLGHIFQ